MGGIIFYIIVILINACIWGLATFTINSNKGYYNNGFWWGFWLGIFGLLVVLCKPESHGYYYSPNREPERKDRLQPVTGPQTVPAGGWKCSCGRAHAAYVSSCPCGVSKAEIMIPGINKEAVTSPAPVAKPAVTTAVLASEERIIATIKEYKNLLDSGAITQEEFDRKKDQLLSS